RLRRGHRLPELGAHRRLVHRPGLRHHAPGLGGPELGGARPRRYRARPGPGDAGGHARVAAAGHGRVTEPGLVRLSEVRMEGVGKRHRAAWAVRDVSISIGPGELYTLLGPAGSGKSTLMGLLAGLDAPDAGRIVLDDAPVDTMPPARRNVGMVFPRSSLWPHMSGLDNRA